MISWGITLPSDKVLGHKEKEESEALIEAGECGGLPTLR